MIRLIKAELLRLVSRRITLIGLAVGLLAVAGLATAFAFSARPPSAADIAAGQQAYQRALDNAQESIAQCEKDPPQGQSCDDFTPREEWFVPQPAHFDDVAGSLVMAGTAFMAIAALIIAASLVGGDFSAGSLSSWLSFEPRRGHVFVSRAIVAVVTLTIACGILLGLVLAALAITIRALQGPGSITHVREVAQVWIRGVGVIAMVVLAAHALAFLTRRTIAVLGIAFGYLVARLVATIFQMTHFYGLLQPWLPENNALAILHGKTSYTIYTRTITDNGISYSGEQHWIGWEHGLIYLGVVLVVLVAGAIVSFRRRDLG